MDPHLFLAQAQRLAASNREEDWRTAVSRAYYAAFHVACTFMRSLGFAVPKAERAHGYLWLRIQNCGDGEVRDAGSSLSQLRSERNRADYDLHRFIAQVRATAAINDATQVIQTLESIAEPLRTQVMDAMKDYERNVLQEVTWHP